jgi:hypothetical protein
MALRTDRECVSAPRKKITPRVSLFMAPNLSRGAIPQSDDAMRWRKCPAEPACDCVHCDSKHGRNALIQLE